MLVIFCYSTVLISVYINTVLVLPDFYEYLSEILFAYSNRNLKLNRYLPEYFCL
jgi:hypothetical protein